MAKQFELYKCEMCGNLLEVLFGGSATPACCGAAMKLMTEGAVDAAKEKHVPVIEKTPTGYKVKVGSVPHPMEEKHWIQWVELIADGVAYHKFLNPGDLPEAEFCIAANHVIAREYCNLHGHWKAEI